MLAYPPSKSFELKCQRVYALVLLMVLIPSTLVIGFIYLLTGIDYVLPDWLVLTLSFALVGLSVVFTLLAIKRWANLPCKVTLNEDGITIELMRRSPFFQQWIYTCSWRELKAVSSNFDTQTGGRFYKIGLGDRGGNIYLSPDEKTNTPILETEFGELLMEFVETAEHLPGNAASHIDKRNFYQSTWALWFTRIVLILNVVVWLVAFIVEDFDLWQAVRLSVFSSIWLTAYYLNRGKN
jgi:hypothetical protein